MYSLKVGENKSLVFPVMCYGYLSIDYDKHIPNRGTASSSDDITYGLFGHDDSFTVAAIVTPYDVNGLGANLEGNGGTGMHPFWPSGINDSKKTMPSQQRDTYTIGSTAIDAGDATSSYNNAKTRLQSYNYLSTTGTNERAQHEMMLFYNTNVQLSLLNHTPIELARNIVNENDYIHSNQPSEYKIKFTIVGDGSSDTLTSDVVITSDSVFSSPSGTPSDIMKEGYDTNTPEVSYEKIGAGLSSHISLTTTGITTAGVPLNTAQPLQISANPTSAIFISDELFLQNGDYVGKVLDVTTNPNVIVVNNILGDIDINPSSTFYTNDTHVVHGTDGNAMDIREEFNLGEELFIKDESLTAIGISKGFGYFRKIGSVKQANASGLRIAWDNDFSRINPFYSTSKAKEYSFPFGLSNDYQTGVLVNGSGTSATWPVDTIDARTKLSIGDWIGSGLLTQVNETSIVLHGSASYSNDTNIKTYPVLYRRAKKEATYLVNTHLVAASFNKLSGEMAIYYNGVKIATKIHSSSPILSFSFPLEDYYIGAKADYTVTSSALTVASGPYIANQVNAVTTSSNPTSVFSVGQSLYNNVGQLIGTISHVSSTQVIFLENIKINLATSDVIYRLTTASDSDNDGNPNIDSASNRKQFMGELHEFAITKGVWDSFLNPNTLIPPYKQLLVYYRFKQEDLND